jgi:hypothetical protein
MTPFNKVFHVRFTLMGFLSTLKRNLFRKFKFAVNPSFDTPLAKKSDIRDSIVVYPEIVHGNPLRARKVVRWLLHKPGFHFGQVKFGPNDLFFYYHETFNDPPFPKATKLMILNLEENFKIFKQTNFGPRKGCCYILRKGKKRVADPAALDGPVIDTLSHKEKARIFNECEYCYSYDPNTMLLNLASLCGCKAVVVPEPGIDIDAWMPDETYRNGIAYGKNDVERAIQTRDKMIAKLKSIEAESFDSVRAFVNTATTYFENA